MFCKYSKYLYSGCSRRILDLMWFHPCVLRRKLAIQNWEKWCISIYGVRCGAFLLQPGADYLWVGLHACLLLRDDKHLIWNEVKPVLGGLALEVAEVHHSAHVQVPEVVPASSWQDFQGREGNVGGGPALSEPVGRTANRTRGADLKKSESSNKWQGRLHDASVWSENWTTL